MKKTIAILTLTLLMFVGCSSEPDVPKVQTTSKFQIKAINVKLIQSMKTKTQFYTQTELQELLQKDVSDELAEKGLLSQDPSMDSLDINLTYRRHFFGDATLVHVETLTSPNCDYSINVLDQNKTLTTIAEQDMIYTGGLTGGLTMIYQMATGDANDKKYELKFIKAIAHYIVEKIVELKENQS